MEVYSLEPRLSVPDCVSQPKLRDTIRNGKPGFEARKCTPHPVCMQASDWLLIAF